MSSSHAIFRIQRVIRAVEERCGLDELDLVAREILRLVGDGEASGMKLNVSEIVRHSEFGSPPTIFSRISRLQEGGWITYAPDPSDGRIRIVGLTARARRAFAQMSAAAVKAISARD